MNPEIQQVLNDFARRRRRLILLRGVCATALSLLGMMALVAALDRWILLRDSTRWFLSIAGYTGGVVAAWFTCLRLLRREPDERRLARLVELVRPELREDLLAAVELARTRPEDMWDSAVFRDFLQQDVTQRVRDFRSEELLPMRLIRGWMRWAIGILAACILLTLAPGIHFGHLMLRAFFPMANLERLAATRVQFKEPSPPDHIVPQGEEVAVVVSLSGEETHDVFLETFPRDGAAQRVPMKSFGPRGFTSSISIGQKPVAYRVWAGDAITKKHRLMPRPRPHVRKFEKTYHFPAYTGLPARTAVDEDGNLSLLEGSEVELTLQVDQPVKEGALRIQKGSEEVTVPLERVEKQKSSDRSPRVHAKFTPQQPGTYRVHLVSTETSFENKFSPQYEIRIQGDLIPRVEIEKPTGELVVPPEEEVRLQGNARDDIGLKQVLQIVRVNEGEWAEIPLKEKPGKDTKVALDWDLSKLGVQPGDRVTTQLVAIDLKGNKGESAPLNVTIGTPGVDPRQIRALETKRALQRSMDELQKSAQAMSGRLAEAVAKAPQLAADTIQRKQFALGAMAAAEDVEQHARQVRAALKDAVREAQTVREASDLMLLEDAMSRIQHEEIQPVQPSVERVGEVKDPRAAEDALKGAVEAVNRAVTQTRAAQDAFKEMLAAEEAAGVARDLERLSREQQQAFEQTEALKGDTRKWEKLARREGAAVRETKQIEDTLKTMTTLSPAAAPAAQIQQALQTARVPIEQAVAGQAQDQFLTGPATQLQKAFEAARPQVSALQKDLAARADQSRQLLEKDGASAATERLRKQIEALAEADRKLEEARAKKAPADQLAALEREQQKQAERIEGAWKSAADRLKDRAAMEELRPDADPRFVANTAEAARAMDSLRSAAASQPTSPRTLESLKEIDRALKSLESARRLGELSDGLDQFAEKERSENATAENAASRMDDWNFLDRRTATAQDDARKGELPPAVAETVSKALAGPEISQVRKEMEDRRTPARAPQPVAAQAEQVRGAVDQALRQMQPSLEEARSAIRKAMPPLDQQMAGLERGLGALQERTRELAQRASRSEPGQVQHETRKLADDQQALNQQLDDLRDTLRYDAGQQDLAAENGRERARDADDALAMLREIPPRAEDLLRQAAASHNNADQERALQAAVKKQDDLGHSLKTIANHYQNLEKGRPEESRAELRKAEEALGMKKALDAEYAQAQRLAEMTGRPPESLLAELEKELQQNDRMRRELGVIAQKAMDTARKRMTQTVEQAYQVRASSKKLLDENAAREEALTDQLRKMATDAEKLAQEEIPAIQTQAGPLTADSKPELERARQSLHDLSLSVPVSLNHPPEELKKKLADLVKPSQQAETDLKAAGAKADRVLKDTQAQDARASDAAARAKAAQESAQKVATQAAADLATARQKTAQLAQETARIQQEADKLARDLAAALTPEEKAPLQGKLDQARQQAANARQAEASARDTEKKKAADQTAADAALARAQQEARKTTDAQGQTQPAFKQAQESRARLAAAATRAGQFGQQVQQIADALQKQTETSRSRMDQLSGEEQRVGESLQGTLAEMQRASRHGTRLGRGQQTQPLEDLQRKLEKTGAREIPQAQKSLLESQRVTEAQPAVDNAADALQNNLIEMTATRDPRPETSSNAAPSDRESSAEEARWMARALDRLDGLEHGPAGSKPSEQQQAKEYLQNAVASAARAQVQALRAARVAQAASSPTQTTVSSGASEGGAEIAAAPPGAAAPAEPPPMPKDGDWGKLPTRIARELMEAQRENVSAEYRAMVEAYFRAIAEKAREKKP